MWPLDIKKKREAREAKESSERYALSEKRRIDAEILANNRRMYFEKCKKQEETGALKRVANLYVVEPYPDPVLFWSTSNQGFGIMGASGDHILLGGTSNLGCTSIGSEIHQPSRVYGLTLRIYG